MKKYLKVIFLLAVMFSFTAGTVQVAEAKTSTQKKVVKVVKKKKVIAKKKGTSRLLSAPLIDPNNPPGGL